MRRDYEIAPDVAPRAVEMKRKRRQPEVRIGSSPAYDLLLSLHVVFGSPLNDYEYDPAWIAQVRAACPPDLHATLAFFFGDGEGQWCAASLCGLLWQAPKPGDTAATIDWLAQLPLTETLPIVIGGDGLGDDWRDVAQSLIQASLTAKNGRKGDLATKIQTFSRRFRSIEREAVVRFLTQPEAEWARLIDAVRAWHELVFAAQEPRISAAVTREATRLERKRGEMTVEELFTSVIRGIAYDIPAAIERLVLVPSLVIMPTIFHFTSDDTITYCYPIKDTERTAEDEQQIEMMRLFDALADKTRLKILRLLTQRQMYLTELAEHLDLTKATTRHHMIRLRAAKLVTVHMSDHLSYYSLRRETLNEPTRVLARYLGMPPQSAE